MRLHRLGFAFLYLAGLLAPGLHEALLEKEVCEQCEALARAEAALEAACDGSLPCQDPSHHHHGPRHDHALCPGCQHARLLGTACIILGLPAGVACIAGQFVSEPALPGCGGFHGDHWARGPPGARAC